LLDPEVIDARVEGGTVDAVAVSDQICRQEVRADGFHDLLRGPRGVGVRGHIDVQHAAAFDRSRERVAKERFPGLRGWAAWQPSGPRHVLRHRVLVDGTTEFRQLAGDSATTPERILARHSLDETHELGCKGRPTHGPRLPRPPPREAAPMPLDDGRRSHDRKRVRPSRQQP
jgi:hypothetical protein